MTAAVERTYWFKVAATGVACFLAAVLVYGLPTVYLYLFIALAGIGSFCLIAFQLLGLLKDSAEAAAPSIQAGRDSIFAEDLSPDDRVVIEWARERLEQGNTLDAAMKLERVSVPRREHPEVLQLRFEIFQAERRWHAALDAAKAWSKVAPDDLRAWQAESACLEELKLYPQAANVLLPLVPKFPAEPMVPFQLARLAAEMGRLEEAQRWLFKALDLGDAADLSTRAMGDSALQPLIYFLGRRALVEKVVSGGLTGAEREGLEFARSHGIQYMGWSSRARNSDESRFYEQYKLVESGSAGWNERTGLNVQYSDATVVFTVGPNVTGAAGRALEAARNLGKPVLHLSQHAEGDPVALLLSFLERYHVRALHVTGSIASREPQVAVFVAGTLQEAFDYQLKAMLRGAHQPASFRSTV